jgi:hypothetical protein
MEIAELQPAEGTVVDGCAEHSQKTPNNAVALAVDPVVLRALRQPRRSAIGALRVLLNQDPAPEPYGVATGALQFGPSENSFKESSGTPLS